jgi:uncharacterized protein involved in exopolysaccharide biosynthesis
LDGFWNYVLKRRRRLVSIWIVVMVLVLIRLVTMREIYTSSCLLMPLPLEQVEQGSQGGFGGSSVRSLLAGGGSSDAYAIAAFLESRQLVGTVIKELDLAKELFPKQWDSRRGKWRGGPPHDAKAYRAFDRKLDITYDSYTGLLGLEVHWWSAERAREIATAMVETGDRMLREAAIADGERRVEELEREMRSEAVSEVGTYLAEETTTAISSLASIRARTGYAFRIIDPPVAPDRKSWPPRTFLLLLTGVAMAAVEFGIVAGAYARASERDRA